MSDTTIRSMWTRFAIARALRCRRDRLTSEDVEFLLDVATIDIPILLHRLTLLLEIQKGNTKNEDQSRLKD